MSRIGKKPVPIGKAKVSIAGQKVNVEGPKGKLELNVHPTIKVANQDGNLIVTAPQRRKARARRRLHGPDRAAAGQHDRRRH